VQRVEDERLITGQGHYTDDVRLPNTSYAYFVRSPYAHARIKRTDKTKALAAPGVVAVLSGDDLQKENIGGLPCQQFPRLAPGTPSYRPSQPILAIGKVRYVGDRVAMVVAETLAQAKDAAELIDVEYEELPAVTLADALKPDAQKVWDEHSSNAAFQIEVGDRATVDATFASAAHVTKFSLRYPRVTANSMEPRASIAYCDSIDNRLTLISSTQNPFRIRDIFCEALHIPPAGLRVRAMDVGGGFGMKNHAYPEEALVVWAAGKLKRPVKWTAERSEGICTDQSARHQITEAALALDKNGRMLALRTNVQIDVGAYLGGNAGIPPTNTGANYPGVYKLPLVHTYVTAAFTNTSHLGPYRASGKPEAAFLLERLMDLAARELDVDPVELRRRNLIQQSDLPFKTVAGNTYDVGDFEAVLNKALSIADIPGYAARRAESEKRGLKRGLGVSMYCAYSGRFSERMEIRVSDNGAVSAYVGTLATGQGHETMFAQMIASWLTVPFDQVRIFQGDTDKILFGRGTFAQRSTTIGGSALKVAADEVVKKAKRISAWMMEVNEDDVVLEDAVFRVPGTDRKLTWKEVAQKAYMVPGIPSELGDIGIGGIGTWPGHFTFPNGCMVAEVEIDIDTGKIIADRITAVDDAGTIINPLTIEGQVHGSIAQGVGETLMEEMIYDRQSGQLLSGSFMDYALPRADVMPSIVSEFAPIPSKNNPLGAKGGSEPGNVGVPSAMINAVIDALSPYGVKDIQLPAKPERVWRAIQTASASRGG
jgi:carbon-monoxide dehydrogenase large subunit